MKYVKDSTILTVISFYTTDNFCNYGNHKVKSLGAVSALSQYGNNVSSAWHSNKWMALIKVIVEEDEGDDEYKHVQ